MLRASGIRFCLPRSSIRKSSPRCQNFFNQKFPAILVQTRSFSDPANNSSTGVEEHAVIGTLDPGRKMGIVFTCGVCLHRCAKSFSYLSYTKGVVLIQCPNCKNRHLIADNLGWFKDTPQNIEGMIKEQGGNVRKIKDLKELDSIDVDGIQKFRERFQNHQVVADSTEPNTSNQSEPIPILGNSGITTNTQKE